MAVTLITIACLAVITFVSFILLDREILSPAFIFPLVFLASALNGLMNYEKWSYALQPITGAVLVGSSLLFSATGILVHRKMCKKRVVADARIHARFVYAVPIPAQMAFALFQVFVYALTLVAIIKVSRAAGFEGGVVETINYYALYSKHSASVDLTLPLSVSTGNNVCQALGIAQAFVLANNVVSRGGLSCSDGLGVVNLLLAIVGSMVGGSRTVAMLMLMAIVVMTYLLLIQSPIARSISRKKITLALLGSALGAALIFFSIYLFRGGGLSGLYSHFSIYLGAPIKNLDLYLAEPWEPPALFGANTLYNLYASLRKAFPVLIGPSYVMDNPYRRINGYDLGNVHTTLYAPIHDFGFVGLVILVPLMALIVQCLYEECWGQFEHVPSHLRRQQGAGARSSMLGLRLAEARRPLAYCLYGYLFHTVALAFFSNKFYEMLFRLGFIEFVVIWAVLFLLLGACLVPVHESGQSNCSGCANSVRSRG